MESSLNDLDTPIASGIGLKLRLRRKVRGLSLRQIADLSGLSIGLISQVERGLSEPSLKSLHLICSAMDMPIRWLFEGPDSPANSENDVVVRSRHRRSLEFPETKIRKELLSPDSVPGIQMMRMVIPPGGGSGDSPYQRPSGAKCGIVLSGSFGLVVDGTEYILHANDSFAFAGSAPHRFWCEGSNPCEALWIVTPALY